MEVLLDLFCEHQLTCRCVDIFNCNVCIYYVVSSGAACGSDSGVTTCSGQLLTSSSPSYATTTTIFFAPAVVYHTAIMFNGKLHVVTTH